MNQLPKYSLIAAMDYNKIIGNENKIPWKAKGEQALFKRITLNSVVIMGRNTYESFKVFEEKKATIRLDC